jgi:hypothetical protein
MDITLNTPLDPASWLKAAMRQTSQERVRRVAALLPRPIPALSGPVSLEAVREKLPAAFVISTSRRRRWLELWIGR